MTERQRLTTVRPRYQILFVFNLVLFFANQSNGQSAAVDQVIDLPTYVAELQRKVAAYASANPEAVNPKDLDDFLNNKGPVAAERFLRQTGIKQGTLNQNRAFRLAKKTLEWRNQMHIAEMEAKDFPCDLFKMGLVFEYGNAHQKDVRGDYVPTNPVIWIRLGALGSAIRQIETPRPSRLVSFAYNTPRSALRRMSSFVSSQRRTMRALSGRKSRRLEKSPSGRLIEDKSVSNNPTVQHVLRSIAWWLNDWTTQNPDKKTTLVVDFEDTDTAFLSYTVGDFLVKLDDLFPNLFDQIIGFRYKPKIYSGAVIPYFNRIFMSRVKSSPETSRKLKFVSNVPKMGEYVPQVDAQGITLLPVHVSGDCTEPDDAKAPAGCQADSKTTNGLYDSNVWRDIHEKFYAVCKPKPRV